MACRYKVTILEKAEAVAGHLLPGAPHVRSASVSPISKPPFSSTNAPPPKKPKNNQKRRKNEPTNKPNDSHRGSVTDPEKNWAGLHPT